MTDQPKASDPPARPREDDAELLAEAPSLKRKKTVTWADGSAERAGEDAEAPAAVRVEGADPLFADLREAALREAAQEAAAPAAAEPPLSAEALAARRADLLGNLEDAYVTEFWALTDELLLRAWGAGGAKVRDDGEPPATRSRGGGAAEAARSPAVAAALRDGGVRAAWEAAGGGGAPSLPGEEELADFVGALRQPEDAEELEAMRARLVARREAFLGSLSAVGRGEAAAAAAAARELDRRGAVAAVCGSSSRFFLRRTAVTLGRGAEAGVDVDLAAEAAGDGAAAKAVSRQQAQIFLDADGAWKVRCMGRRALSVNGRQVGRGGVAPLPHLSLLRVGPLALLFVVNRAALERLAQRSEKLSVS